MHEYKGNVKRTVVGFEISLFARENRLFARVDVWMLCTSPRILCVAHVDDELTTSSPTCVESIFFVLL